MFAPLLLVVLAQAPSPHPQPTVAQLAFGTTNVTADEARFFGEHLSGELRRQGVQVVTDRDIQSLLGLERQKQLLGCSEDSASCMAELSDALGADALLRGEVARFGQTMRANLKLLNARTGQAVWTDTLRADSEDLLLGELGRAAERMAIALGIKTAPPEAQTRSLWWLAPAGVAVAAAGGSAFFLLQAQDNYQRLVNPAVGTTREQGQAYQRDGARDQVLGLASAGVAVAAAGASAWMFLHASSDTPSATAVVTPTGAGVAFGGTFR